MKKARFSKIKASFLISLIVVMVLSLGLTACNNGSQGETTPDQATTTPQSTQSGGETPTEPPAEDVDDESKTINFSYYSMWGTHVEADSMVQKTIEDALNIKIDITRVDHSNTEQVNLMYASGETPDCGWFTKDLNFMHYQQEITRTIPLDFVRTYAPSFAQ